MILDGVVWGTGYSIQLTQPYLSAQTVGVGGPSSHTPREKGELFVGDFHMPIPPSQDFMRTVVMKIGRGVVESQPHSTN